jgi:hypothetical protein
MIKQGHIIMVMPYHNYPHRMTKMGLQNILSGIKAIQARQFDEGARFLRIALRDETVTGNLRATALLWLAETTDNNQSKLNYYQDALKSDPTNADVQARIDRLMVVDLPPSPPPPMTSYTPIEINPPPTTMSYTPPPVSMPIEPDQPFMPTTPPPTATPKPMVSANALYRTVGIRDVRNGRGTGFFINKEGVVVTTRYVVGGERTVRVQLDERQEVEAQVIRAYSDIDVVFLDTGLTIQHLLPTVNNTHLPENGALVAHSHYGKSVTGKRRATKNELKHYWIPTTIETLPDAGGLPLFNDANLVVGMLTKNTSKTTAYCYGVHIHHIHLMWERTQQDFAEPNTIYCGKCGNRSKVLTTKGGFYCESCGAVLPQGEDVRRFPTPDMAWRYGENIAAPCDACQSRVGFYDEKCLRCGTARKKGKK